MAKCLECGIETHKRGELCSAHMGAYVLKIRGRSKRLVGKIHQPSEEEALAA